MDHIQQRLAAKTVTTVTVLIVCQWQQQLQVRQLSQWQLSFFIDLRFVTANQVGAITQLPSQSSIRKEPQRVFLNWPAHEPSVRQQIQIQN
jgi:hypothetical protein